jgi:hypothetical protein
LVTPSIATAKIFEKAVSIAPDTAFFVYVYLRNLIYLNVVNF